MHSVTVTKGFSLTDLLLEGHFMLYSLAAGFTLKTDVFTKGWLPSKDRDAKQQTCVV